MDKTYHGVLLESIFNPAAENLIEAKYVQVVEEEDSGDTNRPERPSSLWRSWKKGTGKKLRRLHTPRHSKETR